MKPTLVQTACLGTDTEVLLRNAFLQPQDAYGPMPFWFWNDEITETGIERQLHAFHQAGVAGFVLHPRIGMPRDIPYLSDRFMSLAAHAVATAKRLGMRVMLYDEAMYPSGSAHGMVVAANPAHASMGLRITEMPVAALGTILPSTQASTRLPTRVPVVPEPVFMEGRGQRIAVLAIHRVLGKEEKGGMEGAESPLRSGTLIAEQDTVVLPATLDGMSFSVPEGEGWSLLLCEMVPSGGTIRGLHPGEDDGEPEAPASADLLNPEAVRSFLSFTHERYASWLAPHFGSTILGFFTDEPSLLGRNAAPDLVPWTHDFMNDWLAQGLRMEDLALLREDGAAGERHLQVRKLFRKALAARLGTTYYAALAQWCEAHHLLLTGHPEGSMDVGMLRYFGIPGQDLVWRWVSPEGDTALTGPHSTMAKSAADAARRWGRRRNANECFGCCGPEGIQWAFSADDMKWMLDWLFVRGTNLIIPHAFYYSLDGSIRYGERPPDAGPNNIWWSAYPRITAYIRRMSWLRTDSRERATVAVLCQEDWVPWRIVAPLYRDQIGFHYVEESYLLAKGFVREAGLVEVGEEQYAVLAVESPHRFSPETAALMTRFASAGGCVLAYESEHVCKDGTSDVRMDGTAEVPSRIREHVRRHEGWPMLPHLHPPCGSLRMTTMEKEGNLFYLLTNEGEESAETRLVVPAGNGVEKWQRWDPWNGEICEQPFLEQRDPSLVHGAEQDCVALPIRLERRESLILRRIQTVKKAAPAETDGCSSEPIERELLLDLSHAWRLSGGPLHDPLALDLLRPWENIPALSGLAGSITYERAFSFQPDHGVRYELDLGDIGEFARLCVNGQETDCKLWRPYVYDVSALLVSGENHLTVEVTNSLAHRYEAEAVRCLPQPLLRLRSGLLGPVRLWCVRWQPTPAACSGNTAGYLCRPSQS